MCTDRVALRGENYNVVLRRRLRRPRTWTMTSCEVQEYIPPASLISSRHQRPREEWREARKQFKSRPLWSKSLVWPERTKDYAERRVLRITIQVPLSGFEDRHILYTTLLLGSNYSNLICSIFACRSVKQFIAKLIFMSLQSVIVCMGAHLMVPFKFYRSVRIRT